MANTVWTDRGDFMQAGIGRILEVDVLLDIGVGIVPHDYITPYLYICCEPYEEYVDILKQKTELSTDTIFAVLNYDWQSVVTKFGKKSVDSVFLLDVIEHLDKETGKRLLRLTEDIVTQQIVIFTPLGFVENHTLADGRDAWGLNGAEWQEHRSGWLPEDFDDTWDIVACKDFHGYSNIGERLEEPFGAFWAIKNVSDPMGQTTAIYGRQPSELIPVLIGRGKHVMDILKQENMDLVHVKHLLEEQNAILGEDRARLVRTKTDLEQEKVVLEQKTIELEQEKGKLGDERASLEQEKRKLEAERASLEQERARLEQQNDLLNQEITAFRRRYRLLEYWRQVFR